VVIEVTKTATLAVLLKPPTNFPRYLDFTSTQWRWAFKTWLPLLPLLTFGEFMEWFRIAAIPKRFGVAGGRYCGLFHLLKVSQNPINNKERL